MPINPFMAGVAAGLLLTEFALTRSAWVRAALALVPLGSPVHVLPASRVRRALGGDDGGIVLTRLAEELNARVDGEEIAVTAHLGWVEAKRRMTWLNGPAAPIIVRVTAAGRHLRLRASLYPPGALTLLPGALACYLIGDPRAAMIVLIAAAAVVIKERARANVVTSRLFSRMASYLRAEAEGDGEEQGGEERRARRRKRTGA